MVAGPRLEGRAAALLVEEARLEEVEKAKFKIDELHKNYYALQSSQKAAFSDKKP